MTALPSGTTHSRYNKQKRKTNYFQIEGDVIQIWNNKWEIYSGNSEKILPVTSEVQVDPVPKEKLPTEKKPVKALLKDKKKPLIEKTDVKYDHIFPTFAEEVMDRIPSPVLRKLLEHYKNADVIEVEINVKTTHTIKG